MRSGRFLNLFVEVFFKRLWTHVVQKCMPPLLVIKYFQVNKDILLRLLFAFVGLGANSLALKFTEKTFNRGIVPAITSSTQTAFHPIL